MPSQNPPNPFARPTFPPLQPSTSSRPSAFQSYSSTSSLASQSPTSSAPLPSPNGTQQQGFFRSLSAQQPQHQQRQQSHATGQRMPAQRQSSFNDYVPDRTGAGATATETATYLSEYALLAEAAKRAQMAVVMRDIEGMEL